jgi:hypothetical protein
MEDFSAWADGSQLMLPTAFVNSGEHGRDCNCNPGRGRKAAAMTKDQVNAASMLYGIGLYGIGCLEAASRRPGRFRCDIRRRNGYERHGPRTSISAAVGLHHNSEGRRHSEDRY